MVDFLVRTALATFGCASLSLFPVPMLSKTATIVFAFFVLALPQSTFSLPDGGIVQLVVQGGVAAILVWIWWKTHTQANQRQEALRETIEQAFQATRENAREQRETMRKTLREHHETQKQLVGVMTRLETKLDNLDE